MDIQEQAELLGKILLAALCGAVIGWQRERHQHVAGLRTMALVAMGTALFAASNQAIGVDRIASNIVTGIGFLGAGIIFREGAGVRGITTAATVWTVAAIGLAITLDLYLIALVLTPVVFLILETRPLSEYISGRRSELPLPHGLRPHGSGSADDEDEGRGRRHEEDEFS
jgi:putative Mg2+ transporter-C (MgtC) family protein